MLMRNKILLLIGLGLTALAFQWANNPTKEQLLMNTLLQNLQTHHYSPQVINDDFSVKVFSLYLKRLDDDKRFFLQSDIESLKPFEKRLDDETQTGEFQFFKATEAIYLKRFESIKTFIRQTLEQPFDFNVKEEIETQAEKLKYVNTEAELLDRWRKTLKYQVLARVSTALEVQEKAREKSDTVKLKTLAELEKEAREKIKKSYEAWITGIEKQSSEERFGAYVNAFASVHEPHSGYFPPLEKENFNIRMAGKLEGIGAQLIEEDGFIKVTRVVPGSASFRQGELQEGDLIIKVAQGPEEPVDVVDMKMDDVLPMIRGKKGTEVRLTVKKKDGSIKVIPIIRDVVVFEESFAKSAIVEHKKSKLKVGLIDLRSFYADFNDPQGRRCARDVKNEIIKLKEEGVDGIVIDLRYNGGGSLSDVVDMTGFFIDRGPVVQVKGRSDIPQVLSDNEGSVLYSGNLVILVNIFSASASEILAAALQDYGRAVIIGTEPSTFGKGTVQRFYELDASVPSKHRHLGQLGSVKVTIQKFYRINGGSTQLKGVVPDIILPGTYTYLKAGEKEEDFPMAWSEIDPAKYKPVNSIGKLDKLKKKSQKRLDSHPTVKLMEDNAKWLKSIQDNTVYSLELNQFQKRRQDEDKRAERYKDINKEIPDLEIRPLTADAMLFQSDTLRAESAKTWHKNLKKDVVLEEAFWVLQDLHNQ